MAALSEKDLDALSDKLSLKTLAVLEQHKKEMHESSRIAREATVEALTGFSWDNRHIVRNTIQWAVEQKDSHTRRRITFLTAITILGVTALWEKIVALFSGNG